MSKRCWSLAAIALCLTWCTLGSSAGAQELKQRLLEWNQCVERQFLAATSNSIDKDLALEFAFGVCRKEESAAIASSGQDFASAMRMIGEAKAAIRRRLLVQP